jgi:hypothetical protein
MVENAAWCRVMLGGALLVLHALGCSSESTSALSSSSSSGSGDAGTSACAPGERESDAGACIAAGLPADLPCPPGQWLAEGGTCTAAGVPPGACGEGFTHDGAGGCDPILPTEACAKGKMAVPGESTCRDVAPCGSGTWGDIPVEPDTEHVDASFVGTSDGSAAQPWTTIGDAIAAAAPGASVAVAAGSYPEAVVIDSKPVRLWGRCPSMVTIVGPPEQAQIYGAINILDQAASGTEVRGVAVTGEAQGFEITGAEDVVLDAIRVHDTASVGIFVEDPLGPTSVAVSNVLVEDVRRIGIFAAGAELTVDAAVVRRTALGGASGRGVEAIAGESNGAPATLTLRRSLVEANRTEGVYVLGADATIENTVVRGTLIGTSGRGYGIEITGDPDAGASSTSTVRTSLVEDNHVLGIAVSSAKVTIDATVVRGTVPGENGDRGGGVHAIAEPSGDPTEVTLTHSLLDENDGTGAFFAGVDAVVESVLVRGLVGAPADLGGIQVRDLEGFEKRATLALRTSTILDTEIGVLVMDSDATIDATLVSSSQVGGPPPRSGIVVQVSCSPETQTCDFSKRSTATIHATSIERRTETGILVIASDATITDTVVTDAGANAAGLLGDGIAVVAFGGPASAVIEGALVERSARAGISAFGAEVTLLGCAIECSAFDLDAEMLDGAAAVLHDEGQNRCGCSGGTSACAASSSMLEPPVPVAAFP